MFTKKERVGTAGVYKDVTDWGAVFAAIFANEIEESFFTTQRRLAARAHAATRELLEAEAIVLLGALQRGKGGAWGSHHEALVQQRLHALGVVPLAPLAAAAALGNPATTHRLADPCQSESFAVSQSLHALSVTAPDVSGAVSNTPFSTLHGMGVDIPPPPTKLSRPQVLHLALVLEPEEEAARMFAAAVAELGVREAALEFESDWVARGPLDVLTRPEFMKKSYAPPKQKKQEKPKKKQENEATTHSKHH